MYSKSILHGNSQSKRDLKHFKSSFNDGGKNVSITMQMYPSLKENVFKFSIKMYSM